MSEQERAGVVIVGGGHAAAQAVPALRRFGWKGTITLVSDEPTLPYHRPPLSKDYLKGVRDVDQILIRRAPVYEKAEATTLLGRRAVSIDREGRTLTLDDGSAWPYASLLLATGSLPRRLPIPGAELAGVHYIRNIRDVDGLRQELEPGRRAVVIGGGYIGLETAASLRALGHAVTLLEAQDRVLERVTCDPVSRFYERLHREEGVDLRTGVQAARLVGQDRVEGVELVDGIRIEADIVVIGIGIVPDTALAADAGVNVDDGILVDTNARTSDPHIFAAGDCTRFDHPIYARSLRLESVQNANDQAVAAASAICGAPAPYEAVPWFWSDQYDVKLQIAGLSSGHDEVILRGDPDDGRSFSALYLAQGRLLAVDAVNRAKDFMAAKKLLAAGAAIDRERAGDPETPLGEAVAES